MQHRYLKGKLTGGGLLLVVWPGVIIYHVELADTGDYLCRHLANCQAFSGRA